MSRNLLLETSCAGHASHERDLQVADYKKSLKDCFVFARLPLCLLLQESQRPQLIPYEPPHVVAARDAVPNKAEPTPFAELLIDGFASGKSSAVRASWHEKNEIVACRN